MWRIAIGRNSRKDFAEKSEAAAVESEQLAEAHLAIGFPEAPSHSHDEHRGKQELLPALGPDAQPVEEFHAFAWPS